LYVFVLIEHSQSTLDSLQCHRAPDCGLDAATVA
jgi:hypothetical protein